MKRFSRIAMLLMVLMMMVAVFAGCGGSEKKTADTSGGSEEKAADTSDGSEEKAADTSSGSEEKVKVVFLSRSMSDPFASWLANSFKKTAEEDFGYEVTIMDQENDAAKSVEMLENAMNTNPDAIVLQPNADAQVLNTIKLSQEKGIPVIVVNMPLAEDPTAAPTVVCDDYTLGYEIAKVAAENLPENANIVIFNGISGMSVTTERRRGFQEGLLDVREDVTLLAEQVCNFNRDEAINTMDDWIQSIDKIDGVLAANDSMVLGAIESFKSNNLDYSNVQFYGIDGLADACLSIQEGKETASVLQDANAMAKEALEMVKGIIDGSITDNPTVSVLPTVITADNVEEMIDMHKANGLIE